MSELSSVTTFIEPFGLEIDIEQGTMTSASNRLARRASDMRGYYLDETSLAQLIDQQNDPLHYEVFETPVPNEEGHLMYCISKLQPGRVGDECFMTKGHYHKIKNTAEIYLCLRGTGYMVMKTDDGKARTQKMTKGQMVYVPPFWAHRSVNAGDDPLISFCVYPGNAGHKYGDILNEGFPQRVFIREGRVVIEE